MLILFSQKTRTSDLNLAGFAAFVGASVRLLEYHSSPVLFLEDPEYRAPHSAIAISADTVSELYREENSRESVRNRLLSFHTVFIYGVEGKTHDEVLQWVSGNLLAGAETVICEDHGEFPTAGQVFTRQLSGAQYVRAKGARPTDVLIGGANQTVSLITVSGRPIFLSLQLGPCNLMVSTVAQIPDPNQRVTSEEDIEEHYDSILPILVFVRVACGDYCWNGGWQGGRLIIDDPVLRHAYGMLDFGRLFESMRENKYSSTVAFIPWNQSRTSPEIASFFKAHAERFSICVHGCDHGSDEYGSRDGDYLEQKSRLAMERMRRHKDRTGMDFDPIMVFPQGRFSTACFRGLRSSGFLAAINSTRFPVDYQDGAAVSLCELLLPALSGVYGFPVFNRHYPKSAFPFHLDLFLGRPAFIVEHHEFFQNGFPALEALANQLNACEPDLAWGSLSETLERTCWKRAISSEKWEARFFTDTLCITNTTQKPLSYQLSKDEQDSDSVISAILNGQTVPFTRLERCVQIETSLLPGQTARILLIRVKLGQRAFTREGIVYQGKMLARRALSEFRDEFLVKYPALLAPAKRFVKMLKARPDSGDARKSVS